MPVEPVMIAFIFIRKALSCSGFFLKRLYRKKVFWATGDRHEEQD
jgi:hypothetical protein